MKYWQRPGVFGLSIAMLGLAIVASWPTKRLVAPAWTVKVTDQTGKPIVGMPVQESFQDYSAEITGRQESLTTDASGTVRFASKTVSSSLLRRALVSTLSSMGGAHAVYGPISSVAVLNEGVQGNMFVNGRLYYWRGSPSAVTSVIIINLDNATVATK